MSSRINGRWVCLCLAICVWVRFDGSARGQGSEETTQIAVSLKGEKKSPSALEEHKLAPELRALQRAGETLEKAKLVGRSQQGKAVVQTDKPKADKLFAKRNEVGVDVSSDTEDFTPIKRLIVSYEKGNRPTDESLLKAGLKVIEDYEKGTFLIVEPINASGINIETVNELDKNKRVKRAYPNYRVKLSPPKPKAGLQPDDIEDAPRKRDPAIRIEERSSKTFFVPDDLQQNNVPQPKLPSDDRFRDLWGMQAINAPLAWSAVTSSPVIVGVIDTGIDYTHPDLIANVWTSPNGTHGYNALTNREDPMDDNGHGTHCAGTIAAIGNNGIGVSGVCWNVKVMGLKFLDARGYGDDYDAIKCIDFAIERGARVLSNSWGGYDYVPEMAEAIERARDAGVLFIAAAGNESNNNNGSKHHFPSSYENENIIAVMSIDQDGSPSYFSNYGFESVDLAAPGSNILSTWPGRRLKAISGTSMATPHVSGAAALLWGHPKFKTAGWKAIKDELLSDKNIQKANALEDLCVTGGVLDLEFLAGESQPTDPVTPQPTDPVTPQPTDPVTPQPTDPVTPQPPGSVLVVSEKFDEPIKFSDHRNVLKIRVVINEECDVLIRADSSITATASIRTVSTGFLNEEDPELRWRGSARRMSVTANRWTPVVASYVVRLDRGSHDLYWKIWDEDSTGNTLTLNAGTMTVETIPVRKQ